MIPHMEYISIVNIVRTIDFCLCAFSHVLLVPVCIRYQLLYTSVYLLPAADQTDDYMKFIFRDMATRIAGVIYLSYHLVNSMAA